MSFSVANDDDCNEMSFLGDDDVAGVEVEVDCSTGPVVCVGGMMDSLPLRWLISVFNSFSLSRRSFSRYMARRKNSSLNTMKRDDDDDDDGDVDAVFLDV